MLRLKAITKFINAVWSTFYWFPTEVWCFHWAEGLCPCGILTVNKRGCCWKRYPFLLLHILQGLKFYQVPDKKLRKLTSSLHWHIKSYVLCKRSWLQKICAWCLVLKDTSGLTVSIIYSTLSTMTSRSVNTA